MQKIGGPIVITVPEDLKARIDAISKKYDLSRAEAARRIMTLGIEVFEDFERIGIPQVAEMVKKAKKAIFGIKQRTLS